MNTTPAQAHGLQIVGYGVEGARSFPQPMLLLMHDLTGVKYPERAVRLVRESDALAAIEAMRKAPAPNLAGHCAALSMITDMCEAARGRPGGPVVGYVADIEALRVERDALRAECVQLRGVVAVQREGLQALAKLMERAHGVHTRRMTFTWEELRHAKCELATASVMAAIDAAIAINGGEALSVAPTP